MPTRTPLYVPVAEEQLRAAAVRVFGAQVELLRAAPTDGGLFNTSYVLETRAPARKSVLRIAPADLDVLVDFEKSMMAAEPRIYAWMRAAGAPIPEVLHVDTSGAVIPRAWIVLEHIDGVPMNHPSVPADAKPDLRRELGAYTRRIHSVGAERFGWPLADGSIRGSPRWDEMLRLFFAETIQRNTAWAAYPAEKLERIAALFEEQSGIFAAITQPRLVHNDLWEPNVLVRPEGGAWKIAALIDGDRAMFADPEFEFVLWEGDPDVLAGYAQPLDPSPAARLRRCWYMLCLALMNLYVYTAEYHDPAGAARTVTWADGLLAQIEAGRAA
jgi:aminoglycoside phosphotransferase (APT) family kinase protein